MIEDMPGNPHSRFDFGRLGPDYDQWYETPAGRLHDEVQKSDVRRLLRPAQAGSRLLDVGCGTGHWSRFFASLGYTVVGVDISEGLIGVAQTRAGPNFRFAVADALGLPFADHCFDVVAAMATLEFVSDMSSTLKEMFRCVKQEGVVLIGTLNRLASINRYRLANDREPYASGRLWTPRELRDLLEPLGRVRMVASAPRRSQRGGGVGRRIARWITGPKSMKGPFIVAEVRP
jgi:SAM-dependent methyltransferase